jgi:hypothetical protein
MTDDPGILDELDGLDGLDADILARVARVHARLDPPPADLNERVRFAIALEDIDVEVSRLAAEELVGSGPRGVDRTRTVTFDSPSLTIMVSVSDVGDVRRGASTGGSPRPPRCGWSCASRVARRGRCWPTTSGGSSSTVSRAGWPSCSSIPYRVAASTWPPPSSPRR